MLSLIQVDPQSVLTLFFAAAAFALSLANARYSRKRDQNSDLNRQIEALERAVADLDAESRVVQKQVALFWGVVEKGIGNMLHSPHRQELDKLIEKNQRREWLEPKEVKRFAELLQEVAEDENAARGEQAAAILLKAAVLARHAHDH